MLLVRLRTALLRRFFLMNAERLVSIIWFVFGGAVAYGSLELGMGEGGEPGSGFVTFITGIFVCVLAAVIYFQSYRDKAMATATFAGYWKGANWPRAVIIVLLTLAFIWLIEILGYFVTSILLLVIIMRFLEHVTWTKAIIIPIITVAVTYLLFSSMLDTNMPRGVLGLW
jgi:hypothetical protein